MSENGFIEIGEIVEPIKIKNGSILTLGEHCQTVIKIDQHFNWFQKIMFKMCFGFTVKDYSEES